MLMFKKFIRILFLYIFFLCSRNKIGNGFVKDDKMLDLGMGIVWLLMFFFVVVVGCVL